MTPRLLLFVALGLLAGLVVLVLVAALVGAARWRAETEALDRALEAAAHPGSPDPLLVEEFPAPVRRLHAALPEDAPPIRIARLTQSGTFRMGGAEDSWKPFTATEAFSADPVGFIWDARIRLAPGFSVHVRDTYREGGGTMRAALLGLLPVVDMAGSPPLAEGALSRYLAEAVWLPTRLVQGGGLTWEAIDASSARATLAEGDVAVSLVFTFDAEGRVTDVEGLRAREVDGAFVPTRWVGRFADYRVIDGYPIPRWGQVAWEIDGELRPYWRGHIDAVRFTH